MKCPKCGYHSFDYLNSCKKCNNDLAAFKSKHNLRSLIFPRHATSVTSQPESVSTDSEPLSPLTPSVTATATAAATTAESTDFGFDFMDEDTSKPTGFGLPELDNALSSESSTDTLPTEDDTFSWDDAPEPVALSPDVATESNDEFSWDEEPPLETAADEEDVAFDENEDDDTFGLDLSWDTDLPALDEDQFEEEETLQPAATDELPDWDFDEVSPPESQKAQKPKGQEEPRDPFDLRGSGEEAQAPGSVDTEETLQPESSFVLEAEPEVNPLTSDAATVAAISTSALTAETPRADDAEDLSPILEETKANTRTLPTPWIRVLALGIDLLVMAVAFLLFLIAGEAALPQNAPPRLLPSPEMLLNLMIPYFLVFFFVCFSYFTLFHFLTSQTPGKMLMRLRVETETGAPLAFSQAFLRSTGGLFSLLPLGLGFMSIFFNRQRRGWNDRLAGTLVVTTRTATTPPPR